MSETYLAEILLCRSTCSTYPFSALFWSLLELYGIEMSIGKRPRKNANLTAGQSRPAWWPPEPSSRLSGQAIWWPIRELEAGVTSDVMMSGKEERQRLMEKKSWKKANQPQLMAVPRLMRLQRQTKSWMVSTWPGEGAPFYVWIFFPRVRLTQSHWLE